ncbi:hypothetical protein AAG570_014005 [Ranatra chinensis]|uniref:Dynein attachment factor N-terminal domain-containing protein n=1 Tax=Ranatra chinensis TaxID=642074 RepID=A0ABD0Z229_9HEMI
MTDYKVDMGLLEAELREAVRADRVYWARNDAKIRAASDQRVNTYEEFEQIVAAAHLRPLDKSEHIESVVRGRQCGVVWNPVLCGGARNRHLFKTSVEKELELVYDEDTAWKTPVDIFRRLRAAKARGGPRSGFVALCGAGVAKLSRTLKPDLPPTLLSEMVEAVGGFDDVDFGEVATAAEVLKALTLCCRFDLALDLMSRDERLILQRLFERLSNCIEGNCRQDLTELGVTEHSVQCLAEAYGVKGLVKKGPNVKFLDVDDYVGLMIA